MTSTAATANRVAAIQHYLANMNADPVIARRYALVASRFEQLRLALDRGRTNKGDSARYREVYATLRALTKELGLKAVTVGTGEAIPGITDADEFLPGDPQRLFMGVTGAAPLRTS
jgi:hypothetical protein